MREDIKQINKALQCACQSNEANLAALTAINNRLTLIDTSLNNIESYTNRQAWGDIPGNSVVTTYYSGVAAGNPSGSTSNIQTITYLTGATTVFTKTVAYNADDLIVSITTT